MNLKKGVFITVLFSLMILSLAVSQAMAGGDPERPTNGLIIGPDVWGVVIMGCTDANAGVAMLRVKQIADCTVYTESGVINMTDDNGVFNCPESPSDVLYYQLKGETIHDQNGDALPLGVTGAIPIIVKVKNFPDDEDITDTASFDVLINFYLPPPPPSGS